ncbi:metallophosphoesterase [Dongia sp.]|uniref:metallophosphoesterase n=1 Tax=Dongia sp. TaxID=1977262 RepID=UPI0037500F16
MTRANAAHDKIETMRVHVFSDLHLEFGDCEFPPGIRAGAAADLVLLAGDIHTQRRGAAWAAETFATSVAMILGNHEAYGDSLAASFAAERQSAEQCSAGRVHPVRVLERETWTMTAAEGTPARVIAATLWTDFSLFGADRQARMMDEAHRAMNDFQMIRTAGGLLRTERSLTPADCLRLHRESRIYLEQELAKPFDGVTIVMTHHAPSGRSIPDFRQGDPINAAYASDLEELIERTRPQLWVHGHIHSSADYRIGSTRVICNPRGYFPTHLNPSFDPALVVELSR